MELAKDCPGSALPDAVVTTPGVVPAGLKVVSKPAVANAGVAERFPTTGVPSATNARIRTFRDLSFIYYS
jgi:hypothetical protein